MASPLPAELLARVLSLLDDPVSLACAEAVSHAFRAAAAHAWRALLRDRDTKHDFAARFARRRWEAGAVTGPLTLRGHVGAVRACALRFDAAAGASVFASGGDDGTARLWRPPPGRGGGGAWTCDTVMRHGAPVVAVCFASPLASEALATAAGASAFLWRADRLVRRFGARGGPPLRALAAADGELFAATADGNVLVFDLMSGALTRVLRRDGGAPALAISVHAPAGLLASAGADGMQVCAAADGRPLPWRFEAASATAVALRPRDGSVAYVGHADGGVSAYCLRTGRRLHARRLHARATVALHAPPDMPDGCVLVAGGVDGLSLLTPGAREEDAPRVRHLQGGYGGDAPPPAERSGSPLQQQRPARDAGAAAPVSLPPLPPQPAAMGALLAAAAGPAWVVSAHGDGAVRVWRLGAAPAVDVAAGGSNT